MEKQLYKIETIKFGGRWWASLYKKVMIRETESWGCEKQVIADNYQALHVKMGEEGFIDTLNKNTDDV